MGGNSLVLNKRRQALQYTGNANGQSYGQKQPEKGFRGLHQSGKTDFNSQVGIQGAGVLGGYECSKNIDISIHGICLPGFPVNGINFRLFRSSDIPRPIHANTVRLNRIGIVIACLFASALAFCIPMASRSSSASRILAYSPKNQSFIASLPDQRCILIVAHDVLF
jgi:hypothetical protein